MLVDKSQENLEIYCSVVFEKFVVFDPIDSGIVV